MEQMSFDDHVNEIYKFAEDRDIDVMDAELLYNQLSLSDLSSKNLALAYLFVFHDINVLKDMFYHFYGYTEGSPVERLNNRNKIRIINVFLGDPRINLERLQNLISQL